MTGEARSVGIILFGLLIKVQGSSQHLDLE